jgi:5-methylthioadenosine/S-adenosylhomocysteine deaminase
MGEVEECIRQNGLRPIEYLDEVGIFTANTIIAHGIYLDDHEMEILAEKDVSITVNTISNLKLASGFAPIHKYEACGINYCFGTDGVASNNKLDMLSEISTTARLHKALTHDAAFLPAARILQASIIGGAKALRLQDHIGSLEKGKLADLIMVDIDTIESQPMYDPYSHLVYSTSAEQVKHVIINGKIVMLNRKLLTVNEEELILRAKEYKKRISMI